MLRSGILHDSVGASFDMIYCSIWPNGAVFSALLTKLMNGLVRGLASNGLYSVEKKP